MSVPALHKGLYDLLTGVFQLPAAWKYRSYGIFASGAAFAGNVNLEAADFTDPGIKTGSRITGIAFEPAGTTGEAVLSLKKRNIPHDPPQPFFSGQGEKRQKSWTTTGITGILPGTLVFLCEYHYPAEEFAGYKNMLKTALGKSQGGPLGIQYVSSITLMVKNKKQALKKWQNLLDPAAVAKDYFTIGEGPAICLVEGDTDQIRSITFKVRSVKTAREFLKSKNLLGKSDGTSVFTDPVKTFDILFTFSEKCYSNLYDLRAFR